MYVPPANSVAGDELRDMVAAFAAAELITTGADGYPLATLLPVVWRDDLVIAHMARANPHWRAIAPDSPALLVCGGPQAYVSPSWYASKAEHGRVVPTWNYTTVHLRGRVRVRDDPDWVRDAVGELTDEHERHRAAPWQVTDAPPAFVAGQLRGIVGIEVRIEHAEGKAKLSQNRSEADRHGVVAGLTDEPGAGPAAIAEAMRTGLSAPD